MKNELEMKKEYEAPEMEIVELKCSATPLLEDSCNPDDCIEFPINNNPQK